MVFLTCFQHDVSGVVYRNMDRLSIIDPRNPENDIAGGSSNWPAIAREFAGAHDALRRRMLELSHGENKIHGYNTILAPLLGGNYTTFEVQRTYMERLDRSGLPPSLNKESYWNRVN
jgi:non-canonical poly(A) RNA polymerase PAPD5/7